MLAARERPLTSPLVHLLIILGAAAVALLIGAVAMSVAGANPLAGYRELWNGMAGSRYNIAEALVRATPLLIISLGIAIAFNASAWNVGAEGQFYMGAIFSTWVALVLPDAPWYLVVPLAILASLVAGGLCAAASGWRHPRPAELAAAGLLLWLVPTAVFFQYAAEGLHLAVFPLLAGALGVLASVRNPEAEPSPAVRWVLLACWAPVISILTPLFDYSLHTLTSAIMVGLCPLFVLLTLMMAPLTEPLFRMGWKLRTATVLALLLAGAAVLGVGVLKNRPTPDSPALNCLCYAVDFREGKAWWLSSDRNNAEWFRDIFKREFPFGLYRNDPPTDAWTSRYFPAGTPRESAEPFRPGDQRLYLKAPAPLPPFKPLEMEVLERSEDNGQAHWKVRVWSPRQASRIWIKNAGNSALTSFSIAGNSVKDCGPGEDFALYHMPASGTEIAFSLPSGESPVFDIREESWIMPTDIEGYDPRPPYMIPEPNRVLDFYSRMHSEHVYSISRISLAP